MQFSISVPPTISLIALIISVLLQPISSRSHHTSSKKLQKRLEEVLHRFSPLVTIHATLDHGESCISPYEEKLRQQIAEELHIIATSHATLARVKDVINKMEEFMSMNDKELCNYRLSLVCDQELRQCVCGPNRANVSFIWENYKCHYAEGSMCMSNHKVECSKQTKCISMSNLEDCTTGLCFCQRDYYPVTTTTAPKTTTFVQIPPSDFDDSEDNEVVVVPPRITEFDSVKSTKNTFKEAGISVDDDDDKVEGEDDDERIIVVKINDFEESTTPPTSKETLSEKGKGDNEAKVFAEKGTVHPAQGISSPAPTRRQELTSAIRRLEREVESLKKLGFGDECSSLSEESNYAEYRRLVNDMDCVTGENDEENLVEILEKLELILESGNVLCNWTRHLQCNSQSKKCECRTSSEDLDGFYLLFMEEAKRCVLVENSRCLSKDYLISRKSPFTNIPCAREAKCIAEETKAECKSKIENCFCRKPPTAKPTETPKKKSRSRGSGKTSSATSTFPQITFLKLIPFISYYFIFYSHQIKTV